MSEMTNIKQYCEDRRIRGAKQAMFLAAMALSMESQKLMKVEEWDAEYDKCFRLPEPRTEGSATAEMIPAKPEPSAELNSETEQTPEPERKTGKKNQPVESKPPDSYLSADSKPESSLNMKQARWGYRD